MRMLFTPIDLFDGFDPEVEGSYRETLDFRTYRATKGPSSSAQRIAWAEQDQRITEGRDHFLGERRCVAIMGGHKVGRDSATYRTVAQLARELARGDNVVASGGGPGAMEATHLGAMLAGRDDNALNDAIASLAATPTFPSSMTAIVRRDGTVDDDLVRSLHRWQAPAFRLLSALGSPLHQSLSIPTWFYGHEPPTPFATHVAKYVSNALREDGLLAIARHGVIYAPGGAGTLQEVFQDAAQNAYRTQRWFSPMCFLDLPFAGAERFWTTHYPIERFLRPLFGDADYDRYVLVTPDPSAIHEFLKNFNPEA